MKHSALFLLAAAALSGCGTVDSIRTSIRDSQRPQEGAEVLHYRQLFEAARRSEQKGDARVAGDTYGWLIGRGSRYGEYGLALLLLRREPGSREAVKNLVACAKRSSNTSTMFPDSAMDSAFSIAAMEKLAGIAVSEHDRPDVAAVLHSMMGDVVTPQVKAWAHEKKSDAATATIYDDIISAVESSGRSREYVKPLKWTELGEIFLGGSASGTTDKSASRPEKNRYSVVKFVKRTDAACQYDFEVRLEGGGTLDDTEKIRSRIRRQLVKEYLSANPYDDARDARISFLSWRQTGETIAGSAAVMKVSVARVEYDAASRRGKVAVRLDGKDVAAARVWALDNIAELVPSKNVVLDAGKAPPSGATFKIGSERMTGDGLLEIEFTTLD